MYDNLHEAFDLMPLTLTHPQAALTTGGRIHANLYTPMAGGSLAGYSVGARLAGVSGFSGA